MLKQRAILPTVRPVRHWKVRSVPAHVRLASCRNALCMNMCETIRDVALLIVCESLKQKSEQFYEYLLLCVNKSKFM